MAANAAKMEALGLGALVQVCRNTASPRKPARKSPRKSATKRKLGPSFDAKDDDWVPKKPKYKLDDDEDGEFKEGRWMENGELHFGHMILCLGDPLDVL